MPVLTLSVRETGFLPAKEWSWTFTPYTVITSKWIRYLNVSIESTALLEENSGKTFDIGFDNYFLATTSEAKTTKEKKNWISTKLKIFPASKDAISSEKATNELGENICKSCIW